MDYYIDTATRNVQDNYAVVVHDDVHVVNRTNVINIRPGILSACPLKDELNNTLSKRLQRKQKKAGCIDMSAVALMCLATDDYSVGHVSLRGITDREMCKIWGLLERISTSSSYLLRQWIAPLLSGRTCEGFMSNWGMSRGFESTYGPSNVTKGSWVSCVDVTKDVAYKISGQPETMKQASEHDINIMMSVKYMLTNNLPFVSYL